jgi:hypothetical protein
MVLLDLVWDQMAGLLIAMKWLSRTAQALKVAIEMGVWALER